MGDEMKYSEGQRNQIYEKYLRPLKLKISQILLYDTNAAADFLKKYNNLLQKTSDSELLDKITELELEIEQYEKTLGKEKTFQDKSSIIIGQVEELLYESEQFTLEEFEKNINENQGYVKAMWCGEEECEDKVKELTGVGSRCIPIEQEHIADTCVCCGKPAKHMLYWGKAY